MPQHRMDFFGKEEVKGPIPFVGSRMTKKKINEEVNPKWEKRSLTVVSRM